jgi:hypothetical protein
MLSPLAGRALPGRGDSRVPLQAPCRGTPPLATACLPLASPARLLQLVEQHLEGKERV